MFAPGESGAGTAAASRRRACRPRSGGVGYWEMDRPANLRDRPRAWWVRRLVTCPGGCDIGRERTAAAKPIGPTTTRLPATGADPFSQWSRAPKCTKPLCGRVQYAPGGFGEEL